MYCETQISTETNHLPQRELVVPLSKLKESWTNYLYKNCSNTSTFDARLAFAEYMYKQELSGRVLYHMTTTYISYKDRTYRESDVNKFFVNFYVKKFLHYVFDTSYFNKNRYRPLQPICYSFVDEHEPKVIAEEFGVIQDNCLSSEIRYRFADRLHHHAVLAVHPDTVERFDRLIGENTLKQFSKKMMTSDLKRCDAGRILYSSKMFHKYKDYLVFPDSMKSMAKKRAKRVCEASNQHQSKNHLVLL
jgi:hypothetical protein